MHAGFAKAVKKPILIACLDGPAGIVGVRFPRAYFS